MNLTYKIFNRLILDSLQHNLFIDNDDFRFFIKSLSTCEINYLIENSVNNGIIHFDEVINLLFDELESRNELKDVIRFPICFN